MHVLRSVCPNGSQKKMHLACLTTHQIWVICLLPAKNNFTGILLMYPLYWGTDVPCNMLSYMFLCCDYIATLLVPQFLLLPTITCIQTYHVLKSEITSRNAKITTLDPNNVFLAAYFYTKFDKSSYIYVYISLPKFAPFLSSLKKSHSLRIPSTGYLHRTPNPTL